MGHEQVTLPVVPWHAAILQLGAKCQLEQELKKLPPVV